MTPADLTTKRKMAIEMWFDFYTSHWSCGRETADRLQDAINFIFFHTTQLSILSKYIRYFRTILKTLIRFSLNKT